MLAAVVPGQSRPSEVQTQTLLPSGSASTVNAGACSSVTSVPPAASAAEMRTCAWSGGTVTSMWNRWRGSSCASVSWNHSVDLPALRVGDVVVVEVVAEHRRPERADGGVVVGVEPDLDAAELVGGRVDAEVGGDVADLAGQREVALGDAAGVVAEQPDVHGRIGQVMSGWWFAASATSPTRSTNASPFAKSPVA